MNFDRPGFYKVTGHLLRRHRSRAGVTQEQLARELEMPRATYANIELGRQRAPADVVWRVALYLGVPLSWLLPEPVTGEGSQSTARPSHISTNSPILVRPGRDDALSGSDW